MVDPMVVQQLATLAGAIFGGCVFLTFTALCFPSVRGALVERLRHRGLRDADAVTLGVQLQALRGEVSALRSEIAERDRLIPRHPPSGRIEGPSV